MKSYIQGSLAIVTVLTLIWGMALLIMLSDPRGVAGLGALDRASLSVLATALLGFSLVCLVAAQNPRADIVYSLAVALILIGAAAAYQMLKTHNLAWSIYNILSLIVALAAGVYLIVAQKAANRLAATPATARAAPRTRPAALKRKAAGKKTAKKASKKAGKKVAKKKTGARR